MFTNYMAYRNDNDLDNIIKVSKKLLLTLYRASNLHKKQRLLKSILVGIVVCAKLEDLSILRDRD